MIRMIAAVSANGVIGKENTLPFHYKEDMKFFRAKTSGSTVIMGRNTFESMGSKPLPKRLNVIVTRKEMESTDSFFASPSLGDAIKTAKEVIISKDLSDDIWLIGGSAIYRDGMQYADEIYLTLIPDTVEGEGLVHFPWIDPTKFEVKEYIWLEDSTLRVARYVKKA